MKRILFALLFLVFLGSYLAAQPLACPPGPPQGVTNCNFACLVCDMDDGLDGFTALPPFPPNPDLECFAGGGPLTMESPQYFAFVAGTTYIEFGIKLPKCTNNDGIEVAILSSCPSSSGLPPATALICGTITPGNPTFVYDLFFPGAVYYLMIDGIDGDFCEWNLEVIAGSANPPALGTLGTINGPTQVCPKGTYTYTIPHVTNAVSYTWTAPPGSKINGGNNVVTLPALNTNNNTVTIQFGSLPGNVCFTASNTCDAPKTTCLPVTNVPIPITNLPDITICYEQLPYIWEEAPNTAILTPGTYTLTSSAYSSAVGCDSIVRQKIRALPLKYKTLPTIFLCEPDCYVLDGVQYCEAGTFQQNLITADGCDSTLNFTLVRIPVKAVVQQPAEVLTCKKTSIKLTSNGSTKGNTVFYNWLNPAGQNISNADTAVASTPGVYTFIVTNFGPGGKVCRDTAKLTVTADVALPMVNAGPDKVLSCANPQVQLNGSGSVGPQYTYLWLASNGGNIVSGSTTLTPTVNATGTYTLRITNTQNGCTAVGVAFVTATTLPPTATATGGSFTCAQPTVTLQSNTNAANPTFTWTGPNGFNSNLQNPSANAAGTYTVVIKDGVTGCTNTATATVTANTQPPGASATGDTLTCVVNSVTLTGGSPASNPGFAWTGPNGYSSSQQNPSASAPGNYVLTVTGANGCTSTATALVVLNNTAPGAALATSGNLNCNNAAINIVATSNAAASLLSHTWTKPDNSTVNTGSNPVLSATQPGAYSVVITNTQNGCTSTSTATVVQSPSVTAAASATLASCNGANNGSVSVTPGGGNGTYSYLWSVNNANTATVNNLAAGTYTVTVTDGENCTATATATVGQPEPIAVNASATPQTANGSADGTATANPGGGTPGYTYLWSNDETTATITGLLPGSYTVTVTDQNGCTAVAVVTVNAYNCAISATVQGTNATCNGANNGSATITVTNGTQPITYLWSNDETTATVTNLAPGTYTATATDAANCPTEVLVQIGEPDPVAANATATSASGPGTSDGTASANPTGGTPGYTYLWSNDETTATITGLAAGNYTVTVTDANNCTAVQTVEVGAGNCGLISDFISINPSCNGLTNGEATVLLTGGNGPFTYNWSSGGDEATETGLGEGEFFVTVTDAFGCEVIDSVSLTQPPVLSIGVENVQTTSCVNTPGGSATVSATGGSGDITYLWSDNQTGPTAINLVAGDFTVTASDANGCTIATTVTIDAVDQEPPVISIVPTEIPLGPTGTVTLTPQLLGLTVTDNCAVGSVTLVPTTFNCTQLGERQVQVTATDDSGNVTVETVTTTIVDNLPPTTECPASIVRCFGDNVVQYSAPVATDNCLGNGGNWELTAGLPSGSDFPVGVTVNTYTYTDAGGNAGSCSFEVNILSQILASAVIVSDTNNQNVGSINLTVSGGLLPYTFEWTKNGAPFATTEDLTNIGQGQYVVVIKDDFGCTVTTETFTVGNEIVDGTGEPGWASGLFIIPNPTSGNVAVIFPDGVTDEVQLTVFDVTGRRVLEQNANAPKQVDLDLTALPSGVYPVVVRIQNETIARRIVVSRK